MYKGYSKNKFKKKEKKEDVGKHGFKQKNDEMKNINMTPHENNLTPTKKKKKKKKLKLQKDPLNKK